jgi:oligopeptidase B
MPMLPRSIRLPRNRTARTVLLAVVLALLTTPGLASAAPRPPVARIIPHPLEAHGQTRIDDYYWLRERDNPEVIAYLRAENAYTDSILAPSAELRESLFREIVGRIKKDDSTVPYLKDGYYYYDRYEGTGEYPIVCRKRGTLDAPEQVLLDENTLARGHAYFAIWGRAVTPDGGTLAFAADTVGRRFFNIRFENLATGALYPDAIDSVTSDLAWANDNRTLFYAKQDPVTLRVDRIYRHALGANTPDVLVYREPDETFDLGVGKTQSEKYVLIGCWQTLSTEFRYLDADHPNGEFRVFQPREPDHEYSIDQIGDRFYIRTNWNAKNFRLMSAPLDSTEKAHWVEVIPHRTDVLLEGFDLFRDFLVAAERHLGLNRIRVIAWDGSQDRYIDFPEPTYLAYTRDNHEPDTDILRYVYTSLVTPRSVYDYNMRTGQRTLRKQEEIVGGYDPKRYRTERLFAPGRDGTPIPVSIVCPVGLKMDGTTPLLLYGYGAYGISEDAAFFSPVLSLLDRGFAYAIAHVRGGEEMGRYWYEDGKLLKKKNTFTDFIDCGRYLVKKGYTDRDRLFGWGGSAGGLLVGAVTNMAPQLFDGIVAEVPFVDVITTMLDADIPLTTAEYDEWGDPNQKVYYDYMLSYSPYDNVRRQAYPNLLVTTGLHDSQVQYWEPAKWVAKLRAMKTDDHWLLLETNMSAGHGGASGRFEQYRELAMVFTFLLDLTEGKREAGGP